MPRAIRPLRASSVKPLASAVVALVLATPMPALADAFYRMQVDGMSCAYCAYGVEKKLRQLEGVKAVHINLEKGRVEISVADNTRFTHKRMERLYRESGFTFRSMDRRSSVPTGWPPQE